MEKDAGRRSATGTVLLGECHTYSRFVQHLRELGKKTTGRYFGLAFGQLASKVDDVGSDKLGRWSWMLFKGQDGHKVRVVVAYQPCLSKDTQIGTVYQQHKRQQQADGCPNINPRTEFREDLVTQL